MVEIFGAISVHITAYNGFKLERVSWLIYVLHLPDIAGAKPLNSWNIIVFSKHKIIFTMQGDVIYHTIVNWTKWLSEQTYKYFLL